MLIAPVLAAFLLAACDRTPAPAASADAPPSAPGAALAPEEARAIARDAYVYGFPIVDSYRIQYAYAVNKDDPEYKGDWNTVHNTARVYTPADKAIQTPNSDTPYSFVSYDLRAEPLVFIVPKVDKDRYFSLQFIDVYTHDFAYVGSRATGNDGGAFLLAGPGWEGATPPGITSVIRSETELGLVLYRTQLFSPDDLENVKKIQAGYQVKPLSAFLGQPAPPAPSPIDFVRPLTAEQERTAPEFFEVLDFVLQYAPTHPSETALMERFARLGIGAGGSYRAADLSPELLQAVKDGMADAWKEHDALKLRLAQGELDSGDLFGTREFLKNDYLKRMLAASAGIYGNAREEAMYPGLVQDSQGQPLDGRHRYVVRFAPGQLPPANAFWSVTMYELPASLLVDNPIDRYLVNSSMLPSLKKDPDGGLTLHVQHESPGETLESNWLPAPAGPFQMAMRLYWPKPEALDGTWKAPVVEKVD
ncbi:DUF1254 domain-containing protein [Pseudoxanthomonas sp. 10H]|uniref:DUF1254 domain-containing protein n=1 Tax=Pseudoxanthomonas sp. 10H TaxID=3242729 RepID=UPI003557C945